MYRVLYEQTVTNERTSEWTSLKLGGENHRVGTNDFCARLQNVDKEELASPFVVIGVAYGKAKARKGRKTCSMHAVMMSATADNHGFRHLADYRQVEEIERARIDQSMEKTGFSDGTAERDLAKAVLKKGIEKNGVVPRRIVIMLHDVKVWLFCCLSS